MEGFVISIEVLDFIQIRQKDIIIVQPLLRQKNASLFERIIDLYKNDKFDYNYNGILINKYSDGEDYIGKHSDHERGLDSRVGVIALSYGAIRKFRIRNKLTGDIEIDVPTESTKIIQMAGNFQKEFTHEIPLEKKVKDCRYSLTFRRHLI